MPEKSIRIEELVKILLKGHDCERAHLLTYEGSVNPPLSTYDLYLQVINWLREDCLVYVIWEGSLEKMEDDSPVKHFVRKFSQQMMQDKDKVDVMQRMVLLQLGDAENEFTILPNESLWVFRKLSPANKNFDPKVCGQKVCNIVEKRLLELFPRWRHGTSVQQEDVKVLIDTHRHKILGEMRDQVKRIRVYINIEVDGLQDVVIGSELAEVQDHCSEHQEDVNADIHYHKLLSEMKDQEKLSKEHMDTREYVHQDIISRSEMTEEQQKRRSLQLDNIEILVEAHRHIIVSEMIAQEKRLKMYINTLMDDLQNMIIWSELTKTEEYGSVQREDVEVLLGTHYHKILDEMRDNEKRIKGYINRRLDYLQGKIARIKLMETQEHSSVLHENIKELLEVLSEMRDQKTRIKEQNIISRSDLTETQEHLFVRLENIEDLLDAHRHKIVGEMTDRENRIKDCIREKELCILEEELRDIIDWNELSETQDVETETEGFVVENKPFSVEWRRFQMS